jgi:hypothetical protein
MLQTNIRANGSNLEHIGWKYYNTIIKKAMEQEFSWSGLSLSLSIAFFVVIFSAEALNVAYKTMSVDSTFSSTVKERIYQLDRAELRNIAPSLYVSDLV